MILALNESMKFFLAKYKASVCSTEPAWLAYVQAGMPPSQAGLVELYDPMYRSKKFFYDHQIGVLVEIYAPHDTAKFTIFHNLRSKRSFSGLLKVILQMIVNGLVQLFKPSRDIFLLQFQLKRFSKDDLGLFRSFLPLFST